MQPVLVWTDLLVLDYRFAGRGLPRSTGFAPKPVMTPSGQFESIAAAKKYYSVYGERM